jgi:hypothetical protein
MKPLYRDEQESLPNDTKLWRYMNLTKFMSLLETSSLNLTQVSSFEDRFEGSLPRSLYELMSRHRVVGTPGPAESVQQGTFAGIRRSSYASCWCAEPSESNAQWKIYAPGDDGLAIATTAGQLRNAVGSAFILRRVDYADFENDNYQFDNFADLLFLKRLEFKYENEVRLVRFMHCPDELFEPVPGQPNVRRSIPGAIDKMPRSISVPVALPGLLAEVRVSPYAPSWFHSLVERIVQRYEVMVPCTQSPLRSAPLLDDFVSNTRNWLRDAMPDLMRTMEEAEKETLTRLANDDGRSEALGHEPESGMT